MGSVKFDSDGNWTITPWEEVFARMQAEDERQARLAPHDPEHRKMFTYSEDKETLLIYWGGYEYPYEMDRLNRPEDVLWLIHHLSEKTWKGMTVARIGLLVASVAQKKGWPAYDRVPLPHEMPKPSFSVEAEREKMTPALRYQVLRRDGHRCRCCGSSVATGSVLHVDHIVPVSRGGETNIRNLQTLCSCCNFGKRDRS